MSFTESKTDSTVRYEIEQPYGVGMRTTEGQKVLNALHKLQQKLNSRANAEKKSVIKLKSNISMNASSSDHLCNKSNVKLNKSTNTTVIDGNKVNISAKLIEKRLDMIEKQLQNLSHLVTTCQSQKPAHNPYPTPSPSVASVSSKDEQTVVNANIHKYVDSSAQTTNENAIKAIHIKPITKSKSTEFIDKTAQTKHFHITSKDIPFILGTSSKSHSAIAKKQIILSKLKQHNKLCYQKPTRKIFEDSVGTDAIDHEIKELLYDLQEEHNYICDEIQHLTQQLENITDTQKKAEFQRELYFLSRRIVAKKKQINELQQLHALIMKNAPKNKTCFEQPSDHFIKRKEKRISLSAERLAK